MEEQRGGAAEQVATGQAAAPQPQIEALREAVVALERQIARAGREQLKANAMAETQAERMAAALDALRAA
ncbi:MAG: hypothetical protein HGA45_22105, partial [Chloroflexales bacterium]|nr:hypothetical protein [Chloroflexales bacterium]